MEEKIPKNPCFSNRFHAAIDAKLAVNILGVDLNGIQGEINPGGDFLIGQPFGDKLNTSSSRSLSGSTNSDSRACDRDDSAYKE